MIEIYDLNVQYLKPAKEFFSRYLDTSEVKLSAPNFAGDFNITIASSVPCILKANSGENRHVNIDIGGRKFTMLETDYASIKVL